MAYICRDSKHPFELHNNHHHYHQQHHYHHHHQQFNPNHNHQRHHYHLKASEPVGYSSSVYSSQTDENRNENVCGNKEFSRRSPQMSSRNEITQKVDVATMTDPLRIDFKLTSEYLTRCSKGKLERHMELHTTNGMSIYPCPECTHRFEDPKSLHEHLEEHRQRPHICDICGASLKRKEHLDRHKQGHNKDRPYQCSMCCKAFKRNEHLARHMITHSGSKNQICTQCGKAFYRKDHLKKHIRSHNDGNTKSFDHIHHQKSIENQGNESQYSTTRHNFGNVTMIMDTLKSPSSFSNLRP